jgi:hypothetical protein
MRQPTLWVTPIFAVALLIVVGGRSATPQSWAYLNLSVAGARGAVEMSPSGVLVNTCSGSVCTYRFPAGTPATLIADQGSISRFVEWSYDCTGSTPSCPLTIRGTRNVKAAFTPVRLWVTPQLYGVVWVFPTRDPTTATCGGISNTSYCWDLPYRSSVRLEAHESNDGRFAGWVGACRGQGRTCRLKMYQDGQTTGIFECAVETCETQLPLTGLVTLTVRPIGSGEVQFGQIRCPQQRCSAQVPQTQQVPLRATAALGWHIGRWGGDASCHYGSTDCVFKVSGVRGTAFATVTFDRGG